MAEYLRGLEWLWVLFDTVFVPLFLRLQASPMRRPELSPPPLRFQEAFRTKSRFTFYLPNRRLRRAEQSDGIVSRFLTNEIRGEFDRGMATSVTNGRLGSACTWANQLASANISASTGSPEATALPNANRLCRQIKTCPRRIVPDVFRLAYTWGLKP